MRLKTINRWCSYFRCCCMGDPRRALSTTCASLSRQPWRYWYRFRWSSRYTVFRSTFWANISNLSRSTSFWPTMTIPEPATATRYDCLFWVSPCSLRFLVKAPACQSCCLPVYSISSLFIDLRVLFWYWQKEGLFLEGKRVPARWLQKFFSSRRKTRRWCHWWFRRTRAVASTGRLRLCEGSVTVLVFKNEFVFAAIEVEDGSLLSL